MSQSRCSLSITARNRSGPLTHFGLRPSPIPIPSFWKDPMHHEPCGIPNISRIQLRSPSCGARKRSLSIPCGTYVKISQSAPSAASVFIAVLEWQTILSTKAQHSSTTSSRRPKSGSGLLLCPWVHDTTCLFEGWILRNNLLPKYAGGDPKWTTDLRTPRQSQCGRKL